MKRVATIFAAIILCVSATSSWAALSLEQTLPSIVISGNVTSAQSAALTANPTIGNTLTVTGATFSVSSVSAVTVSDTAGNTWTVDEFRQFNPTAGNFMQSFIARAPITVTGSSFKITVSTGIANSQISFQVSEWSGGALTLDNSASNDEGQGTTATGVLGSALSTSGELLLGSFAAGGSKTSMGVSTPAAITGPALTTAATSLGVSQDDSTIIGAEYTYAIASSTSAPTFTWTYTSDTGGSFVSYVGTIATYKASGGGSSC